MPGTNTLAYYKKSVNYGRNKFYDAGPWASALKLFTERKIPYRSKLDCLSPSVTSTQVKYLQAYSRVESGKELH
jgi:hypothetical protein